MIQKQYSTRRNARMNLSCESLERRELMAADFGGVSVPVDPQMDLQLADFSSEASASVQTIAVDDVSASTASMPVGVVVDQDAAHLDPNAKAPTSSIRPALDYAIVDPRIATDSGSADDFSGSQVMVPVGPGMDLEMADLSRELSSSTQPQTHESSMNHVHISQGLPFHTGSVDQFFGGYCGVGIWGGTAQ